MLLARYVHDVRIAVEAIRSNKLKSLLTALGIIFGVAAVISMLAIGSGAKQEILEQMKSIGVNNIEVHAVSAQSESSSEESSTTKEQNRFSPGLSLRDVAAIRRVVPTVRYLTPVVSYDDYAQYSGTRLRTQIVGIGIDFLSIYGLRLEQGSLISEEQYQRGAAVCLIGSELRAKLFGKVAPVGKRLKVGGVWFEVIGVLTYANEAANSQAGMGLTNYNGRIFVPFTALTIRYRDRGKLTQQSGGGQLVYAQSNIHQLDKIVIQVDEPENVAKSQEVIGRLLSRLHQGVDDYQVIVPEQLLRQQQRTKDIFNLVLGLIAGISLLVGGIGIMNIMYATVMERIKEIGTRLAIGAKWSDIVAQFLSEAVLISVSGGLIGVVLGVVFSYLIMKLAGILTVVTLFSVLVVFGVSVAVGVIFGFAPARNAARRNPIESLRYE